MEIINIICPLVTIASLIWGIHQWKSKKKTELFPKRYSIKVAVEDFIDALCGQNADVQTEWAVLKSRTGEARYLFGPEIIQFIDELKDTAANYNVARIGQKASPKEDIRLIYKNKYIYSLESLLNLRERIDGLFDKYLIIP